MCGTILPNVGLKVNVARRIRMRYPFSDQPQEGKMNTTHGFSLTEVLISLVLVTSTSLALLQQQRHASALFHRVHERATDLLLADNRAERWNANRPLSKLAAVREVRGKTERRTGLYTLVHEDSSTVKTKQFSSVVDFRKRSNE